MKVINSFELGSSSSSSLLNAIHIRNENHNSRVVCNSTNNSNITYTYTADNDKKRKYIDDNEDNMIKKVLEGISDFNSIESNIDTKSSNISTNSNHDSDGLNVIDKESVNNSNYEELLLSCKACHILIIKYKATSATNKLKSIVTTIATIIDDICNTESNSKKLQALSVLGIWLADDEILVQIAEHYHKHDHIRTIVLVVFVAMLLLKARSIRAPATRTFMRAIELMVKYKTEVAIAGLLSRIIRFPNHINSNDSNCPVAIMTKLIGIDRVNTIPGNFQFELFQRSARQLLSKQQKDSLLNYTFNVECIFVEMEFLKLLDGVLSPLAIMKSNDINFNIDTIFDEWKRLIGGSTLSLAIPNSPVLWDNENLKILNSVLTGCPEMSIATVKLILLNLDDMAVGNISICSSINLAAALHTITTKCITIITNNDDILKLARALLLRCSNPMAKNALTAIDKSLTKSS